MRRNIIVGLLLSAVLTAIADEEAAFSVKAGLFDASDSCTLGLQRYPGAETFTVFSPTDSTDHYSNGVVMTEYKGTLYCMWQSSRQDEDSPDTWIAYSTSTDGGTTWGKPKSLTLRMPHGFMTSGGWLASEDLLVAYINHWSDDRKTCTTLYMETEDGTTWKSPRPMTFADGMPMRGIIEQDPHRIAGGRIVSAIHLMPGMMLCPIYTDDPSGRTGWKMGNFKATPNGKQSAELEPSFFLQSDGTLVMTMRDQKSSHRVLTSISRDRGETWTTAAKTDMPDSRAKQSAGNLPDGTAYIVNNPITHKSPRLPLAITLSPDGKHFTTSHLIRSGDASDLPAQRYPGRYKGIGYSYPKSMVSGSYLYISYSTNKELVQYTRLPLRE